MVQNKPEPTKREDEPRNPEIAGTAREDATSSTVAEGGVESPDVGRNKPRQGEEQV